MSGESSATATDGSRDDGSERAWPPAAVAAVRADRPRRWTALAAAAAVGLAVAWVHWAGLLVAGALVGVVSATTPRAVAAGLAVGVAAVAGTVLASPAMSAVEFLALTPPVFVTVVGGLALPAWGSLVRLFG